jgi:UDP-2,3-diacylglucosamine pyrophosphatase LpxH
MIPIHRIELYIDVKNDSLLDYEVFLEGDNIVTRNLTKVKKIPIMLPLSIPVREGMNLWANVIKGEKRRNLAIAANIRQKFLLGRSRFVYFDVGGWLDGQHYFGLLYRNQAALCQFDLGNKQKSSMHRNSSNRLVEFISQVQGASVVSDIVPIGFDNTTGDETLYLFLPDLHITDSPSEKYLKRIVSSLGEENEFTKHLLKKRKQDIKNTYKSIPSLIEFFKQISKIPWSKTISLLQLGDMYELWAGRKLLLAPPNKGAIEIQNNAEREIIEWINEIHNANIELFHSIDKCPLKEKRMLYGNHDSYLFNKKIQDYLKNLKSSTKVYPRQKVFHNTTIYAEHGHAFDIHNNDSSTYKDGEDGKIKNDAFNNTNTYFNPPIIPLGYENLPRRAMSYYLDPTRRKTHIFGATLRYLSNERFGIYVMGHTHAPHIAYIDVYPVPSYRNIKYDD